MDQAELELRAALDVCALADRSALDRLRCAGPDFLGLLHRLCTADVKSLAESAGRPAVLTTPKGRIVDRVFVHRLRADDVLLVCGAGSGPTVAEQIRRFTFRERIDIAQDGSRLFTLIGPRAGAALERAGLQPAEAFGSRAVRIADHRAWLLGHDGSSAVGHSLLVDADAAGPVWNALDAAVSEVGGRPVGAPTVEAWRILRGLPASGSELNGEHNPLEAGLREAVSFSKGCYVGQEVVARLDTYDKVSREILGIECASGDPRPTSGEPLFRDGREIGRVTSATQPAGWPHPVGLAYVKRRAASAGDEVRLDGADAERRARLVALPFPPLAHSNSPEE